MSDLSDMTHTPSTALNMHSKRESEMSSPATERKKVYPTNSQPVNEMETSTYPRFSSDLPWSQRSWMYQLLPFRGIYYDFRRRAPFFASDWTTAFYPHNWWTVAQYIPRMYFINLMPAISYIIDMNHRTDGSYGLNEVILASALAAIVFPVFSIQPLTFVGVTGLINLVNYTQYDLVVGYYGLERMDYLRVQAWSLIWAAGFHFLVSIFNVCDFTRFITDMTSSTFGFYVGIVYIQKGIELLLYDFEPFPLDNATGWLSVTIAILFTVSVYLVTAIGKTSFLPFKIRYFTSSFAFAAGCIFWTGFSHFPKNSLERVPISRLPITKSFFPTLDRSWFIDFWNIEAKWAFVGAPLGFLIMLLFYFDHNVSSVMAQARQFPVKRPAGFHWDFFLLGITTLVSGFLGLPAPNGLVPQCPWSTEALSVYDQVEMPKDDQEEKPLEGKVDTTYKRHHIINTRVVENRLGHLVVGLLTLGTMTRPLLVVLGTMPRALFAGIFILVGWSSIEGNPITARTLAIFRDRHLGDINDDLLGLRRSKIALFVGIQWVFFAMTIAISQTIAAIGFPVIITLLIPFRYYIVPKWFSPLELRVLDAPTADADVVLASIGQETEAVTGQGQRVARDTGIAGTEWQDGSDDEDYDAPVKQRESAYQSDAPGYTIRGHDDDEEEQEDDSDQVEVEAVRPTDVIAHMTDLGGGGGGSAAAGEATPAIAQPSTPTNAAADATAAQSSSSSSPTKNNKRNKSATQSWWGLGGSNAVERAPSPHTPVTPLEAPESAVMTPGDTAKGDESTGLKKFFASKKDSADGSIRESPITETPAPTSAAVVNVGQMAVDQHFASHNAAVNANTAPSTGAIDGTRQGPTLTVDPKSVGRTASTSAAGAKSSDGVENGAPGGATENTAHDRKAAPAVEETSEIVPVEGSIVAAPVTNELVVATSTAAQTSTSKGKSSEAEAAGAEGASAAAMYKITEEYKQKEKAARDANVAAKKKKEDDKRDAKVAKLKAKDDKKRLKAEKAAAKKKEKEDKKRKKEEAALIKKQEKEKAKKAKQETAAQKEAKRRDEEKAVVDKKHAEDVAATKKKLAEEKEIADKNQREQEEHEAKKQAAAEGHTDKELGGITALAAVAVGAILGKDHHDKDKAEAVNEDQADTGAGAETSAGTGAGADAVAGAGVVATDHHTAGSEKKAVTEAASAPAISEAIANPYGSTGSAHPGEDAAIAAPTTDTTPRSTDAIAPVVVPIHSQAEVEKEAEERRARQAAAEEEEQSRKKAEGEAALAALANDKAALERDLAEVQARKDKELSDLETSRQAKENEIADSKEKEEAALALLVADRKKAEEDAATRKQQEEEAAEKEVQARKTAEEEQARKKAEEEAALVAVTNDKAAVEQDLADVQARKDKELGDLEESKKTKEKETADNKEKEEAALALLVANQKKTEDDIALRKEQEEKEAAERKAQADKEAEEAAAKRQEAEKEAAARKEKEEADLAKARQEKLALEAEIAALEAKARSARTYLAPTKVPKSSLTALSGQVAGHEESVYALADQTLIAKKSTVAESSFYQNVLIHQTAVIQQSQLQLLNRLRKYLPTYHGTIELTSEESAGDSSGDIAVILENLTRGYKHANVLDIKLGKQFWDESSSEEKKKRMTVAAKSTTSGESGIRLTGWQVWNKEKGASIKVDKKFGKTIKTDQLYLGLRSFFGVSSKEEAVKISEITGTEVPATVLPEKPIEHLLHDGILPAIKEIIDVVKKLEWRVRGGSLLIVYEGDEAELNNINPKSTLEVGRHLTDTDQLVDTSDLNKKLVPTTSRVVDVRLIDFAHASFASEKGADEGYLAGLETTKRLLDDLYKEIHKGKLHPTEAGSGDGILKNSGGADLMGAITGLFSRDKGESQVVAGKDKDKEIAAPVAAAPEAKETKEVAKPSVAGSKDGEQVVEVGGAGAAIALAASAVKEKKSSKKKETEKQPKKAIGQPEQSLVAAPAAKESKAKQGGGLKALFSARLVEDKPSAAPKQKAQSQYTVTPVATPAATPKKSKSTKAATPKASTEAKQSSFEIIRTGQPKKEIKEKSAADGSALDAQVPPEVLAQATAADKGKGKAKEVVDPKLTSFWQVKDTSELTKEEALVTPTKSTGPRKVYRHENPIRGGGKPVPAVQFRAPLD